MITIDDCTIFAEGLDHPEGIAFHKDGSLWAGGEAGQIYRIEESGQYEEVANTGGFILGLAFSKRSEWLAICDLGKKCIWRMDPITLKLDVFASGAEDHRFNIPNYAVFDENDHLYVSESGAFREVNGKIIKFSPDGNGVIWYKEPLNFANGMALSNDGTFLYVVVSFLPGVVRIPILNNSKAGKAEVYCTLPESVPDGLAFDAAGNLYVSCYSPNTIYKVTENKEVTVLISDWEAHTLANPTNIAFGGTHFDQIYTANLGRWHITRINAGIAGNPLVSHR
ncbi:MAG TPA: SMP-30/gluconolactonase/LRE family protein [Saprospiraceae bacterium]|nr:SMP-30/gluconolactonase/LRE family protein [Saprospiraceae bacterium]